MSEKQEFVFDKFVKDLEEKHDKKAAQQEALAAAEEEWQARHLLRRYREHPLNLRKFGK